MILHEWPAFYSKLLNIHWSGVLTVLTQQVPHETGAVSAHSVYTIQLCTMSLHANNIHKVHTCLAVTCHLHFRQNDWDFLHATVVAWWWNRYRNTSQHRKLTLEKKILPLLLFGFEPVTFQSQVWCSNHWAIPTPPYMHTHTLTHTHTHAHTHTHTHDGLMGHHFFYSFISL